jgi:glycosyltransferase involved in cell wall biosynthesis
MAKVFIGIPTLNRPDLVLETVDSVRRQSFADYRVIVSDNRSDGDCADRVERSISELGDPRFTFHRQPVNGGEYGQGRFFIAAASDDELFMILHDDDLLQPGYLAAGVDALAQNPGASLFVANPHLMNREGVRSSVETARYRRNAGRNEARDGLFDVLAKHLMSGFTPISGTLFRKGALAASGFVDADCHGSFPFESNVFLRLGDIGAKGWFTERALIGFRFHQESARNYLQLNDNPDIVRTSIRLFARRSYSGALERRRRAILSRLYRADALIRLRQGDVAGCRATLRQALRENARSAKAWGLAPLVWLSPGLLRAVAPPLRRARSGPLPAGGTTPAPDAEAGL